MEKFTRLFLLGEHSIVGFLRKIGLGLALVLWTTIAFAESQVTYQVKVACLNECYRIDNVYSVPVTMKDFVKIKKLAFELKYSNTTNFNFIGLTNVNTAISTVTVQQLTDGTLTFNWANTDPVTISEGAESVLFNLNFQVDGFQHQYLNAIQTVFNSVLTWTKWDLYNVDGQCDILSDNVINGCVNVTEKWPTVVLDYSVAKCVGQYVTVTVSTPENVSGMMYSFNGQTYTSSKSTDVYAPSLNNQLIIKDATCISYVKKFDVKNIDPLAFTAATPVYAICPGGLGDIEIKASKGNTPYTYYVIPEEQWTAGDLMKDKLTAGNVSLLSKYTYANYVIQVPAGTVNTPKKYWVAVQDANGCAVITGTNLLSWWKEVSVINDKTPFAATPTNDQDLVTTCYGQPDGRINFVISGGTPFKKGYNISLGGIYVGRSFSYDSNVWEDCNGTPCSHAVLSPGCYEFTLVDSLGCSFVQKYCVTEPKKIVFDIDHTDAGCDQAVGQLWIKSVDASTGSGPTSTWRWHYSTDETFATNVSAWFSIETKVTNIPAGVYYVEVQDGNGCTQMWYNAAGDNAVKILTTVFDIVYTPIKCWGDLTTSTVVLVSGDANHVFNYKLEKLIWTMQGGWQWVLVKDWQTSNIFTSISGDVLYRYSVKDLTASNCIVTWTKVIHNPPKLDIDVLTFNTRPPTCPENNDGNISVMAHGGRPWNKTEYLFSLDGNDWKKISNFAAGAGEHTIVVKDSAGCTATVKVRLPGGTNMINFARNIEVACKNDSVNLFNSWPGNDRSEELGWWNYVGLDKGWLIEYSWYLWENHLGDNNQYVPIQIWTSANGWELVPFQGSIYSRNPKLYATTKSWTKKSDIALATNVVSHSTKFGAGTYFLVSKDEWGCYSNVDTITVKEPKALAVDPKYTDAGCYNTTSGLIEVKGLNGRFRIPYPFSGTNALYQYVLVQQPDIFNQPNWYGTQAQWIDFQNENDWRNDSVLLISVKKGTYWLAIRDYCASHDPSQIIILNEIVIGGKDAITANIAINDALCYGDKNASVIISATAGGFGGYSYELKLLEGGHWPSGTVWPFKSTTGIFNDIYAGVYQVTVKDSKGCAPLVKTITVKEPGKLILALTGVDASCFGSQDGIIRYTITGGTAPFKESTNNGANWYTIAENTRIFDRRAGAGTYIVWLQDAHNCMWKDTLVIDQPKKLAIDKTVATSVSCPPAQTTNCKFTNVVNDGTIKVYWSGGWNALNDVFKYTITATKGTDVRTMEADVTTSSTYVTFTGLTSGEWTIKVWEHSWKIIPFTNPYIMDPAYVAGVTPFTTTRPEASLNPQQNPDITVCLATTKVVVGAPNPIAYTVEYHPVLCRDTHSGEIHIHNVTGGTGPYWFMLEGPADNTAALSPESTGPNGVWKPVGDGVMEMMFKGLPYGIYNVFIKDSKGCVVCLESGDVLNQKALTLMVSLVKNAECYDTPTGQIKLEATSFPVGYTLKYAIALAADVEEYLFPLEDETFVNRLVWQDSPIFNVKSGVWIGYVKAIEPSDPSRGYCIQGHSTDKTGQRILNHRIFVDQPTQVIGAVWDKFSVKANCWSEANGKIKVSAVSGGSGTGYSAHVFGTTFDGKAVDKWYSNVEAGKYLDGLYASTDKTDTTKMVAGDYYKVVFIDSKGCLSPEYLVAVQQPTQFIIELVLKQDAFICPEDLAGVFEIRVVSGGTGAIQYMYEAWDTIPNPDVLKLSSPWGAINTFQGPAGLLYKAWARDANLCSALPNPATKYVAKPIKIAFDVLDRSCYGDATATAKIILKAKDAARTYKVRYLKYPETDWTKASAWSSSFTSDITLTGLTYGDESERQGHYTFQVMDNLGCSMMSELITFVPVQTELKTCCATVVPAECTGTLAITITGGVTPYIVSIDGVVVTGASWVLQAGAHTILVEDAHGCKSTMMVTVDANPVARTASAVAYVGEKVKFTDAEAKLDTMLSKGVTTVKYAFTNGCMRTLVITVTEQYRTAKISEIQGTGEVSPLKDLPRQITGTVTAVVPGVGYFVQDARDAVNGNCGIFVADTKTVVLENTGVKVSGIVRELNDVTTLEAQVVEIVAGTVYEPIVAASPADAKNEKWESVLVKVEGTRFQGSVNPDGSWVIKTTETNNILVNDWMFSYTPVDGHYFTVTGIINGANSLFKLEPRKAADVIDLTKTTPVIDVDNLQFKVYPNPFNDYLNIDNSDKLSRVTITNIAGQRVMDVQYPERVIRTSNLVSGVYVITLFTEEGIAKSERMVKR